MLLGGTAGGGEAVAAGAGFDDVSPVGHAIDNGGGEAGVGEGFSHLENGELLAMAMDARSSRSVRIWKSSSAARWSRWT